MAATAACSSGSAPVVPAAAVTTVPTVAVTAPPAPPETTTTTAAAPAPGGLPGDESGAVRAAPRREPLKATGRIEIPRIGLSHTTYEGIALSIIDHGPSHWPGTALPGQPGNAVFPGHRVTHSRPFYDIDKLAVGDEVVFVNDSGRHVYQVTETLVVGADALWITRPTAEPTFTIFACHPKGSARQRYVVKGRLVPPAPAPAATPPAGSGPSPPPTPPTTHSPLCVLCLLR